MTIAFGLAVAVAMFLAGVCWSLRRKKIKLEADLFKVADLMQDRLDWMSAQRSQLLRDMRSERPHRG